MIDYGLVSIITPTWQCAAFIEQTIKSVLAQTYPNWELIIQDDCSTDETSGVVAIYSRRDSRIKYECNNCNMGAALTRNAALYRAQGRWMAFLDSDDLWMPTKLEHQLRFMVENNYAFSYHNYIEITEDNRELGILVSGKKRVNKTEMYMCCWPGCLTVIYDRMEVGLVQIHDIKKNNDTAIWLKVICKSPCYLLNENLAKYRRRGGSITPKSLPARLFAHYPLFHVAEEMNPVVALWWTLLNVLGNLWKKTFYIRKYRVS